MENNRSRKKSPQYIEVYNKILKNIQDGLYQEEQKLPNEMKLAEQVGVSRMTLRQALQLLKEDGIIEARKGVGNFLRNQEEYMTFGLEEIGQVLKKCGITKVDAVVCEPRLDPSVLYTENVFERKVSIFLSTNLYYYFRGQCYAHCFSTIPTDVDFIEGMDITDEKQVRKLICEDIYNYTKIAKVEIKGIKQDEKMEDILWGAENSIFALIVEKLLDIDGKLICVNKYYIPIEYLDAQVTGLKK